MHDAGLGRFDRFSYERLDSSETRVRCEHLRPDADLREAHDLYFQLLTSTNGAQKYGCA
jgi:hypothetical protein